MERLVKMEKSKVTEYDLFSNTSLTLLRDTLKANAKLALDNLKLKNENDDLKKQLNNLQNKMIKKDGENNG